MSRVYIYGQDRRRRRKEKRQQRKREREGERGRGREGGSGREFAGGYSHWPQTGTGVWIAHNGLASKLGWTSNLLCSWSFEEKRQLPTSKLPAWMSQQAGELALARRLLDDPWMAQSVEGGQNPACLDLSFWICLWNKRAERGKRQWRRRGNSVTFTSSPGNDALASGIRLEGMWVERMSRGRNTEAGAFFFFFYERDCGNQSLSDSWCDIDELWCVVPCVCDDGGCVFVHVCLPHLPPFIFFFFFFF